MLRDCGMSLVSSHITYSTHYEKNAYSNILKISPPETENFQNFTSKNSGGGSNEYPQSMFLIRNKNIMYIPVKPSFTKKKGFKGSKLYRHVFLMCHIHGVMET